MLLKYDERIKLLTGSFTYKDFIAPYGVLDVFQGMAGEHAELINMGYNDLLEKGVAWILITNRYIVLKNPPLYGTVLVETWPRKKEKFDFYREYRIKDDKGEDLVHGISRWVMVDVNTRRIVIPREVEYQGEYYEKTNFPGKLTKTKDFDITGLKPYMVTASITDLDHNMHVNNARYPFYILDAIQESEIKEFEITYMVETKLGETINVYYIKEDKTYYVKGIIEGKGTCFLSKLEVV